MSATPPYSTFQFLALRVTQATAAGHPVPGANQGYFTKAVVDAGVDLDIQSGAEDTLLRGDGLICATSKDDDVIKRAKLDLNLCNLDAALISMITGALLYNDSGTPAGYQVLGPNDAAPAPVILEGWSKAWDGSVQAAPSVLGSVSTYWHWVFPLYRAQLSKVALNSKHNAIPVSGVSDVNAFATVNGPYDDWPAYISAAGGVTRPYGVFLDSALPAVEGYLTVTGAAS